MNFCQKSVKNQSKKSTVAGTGYSAVWGLNYGAKSELIQTHDLVPGGNKVCDKTLVAIVISIDFSHSPQLGV